MREILNDSGGGFDLSFLLVFMLGLAGLHYMGTSKAAELELEHKKIELMREAADCGCLNQELCFTEKDI